MSKNKKNTEPQKTELQGSETEVLQDKQSPEQLIEELQKEVSDWKDKYLRSMAEFDNFRRRSIQEKADWIRLATEKMALNVCDVVDNFERALLHIDEASLEDKNFKGILLIEQQLRAVLDKEGVKVIAALGEEFDPTLHEALAHIASEYEENKVAAIIQNGYTMHDKVIRPVRVAVSNGTNNKALEE